MNEEYCKIKEIGKGSYGTVYTILMSNGNIKALKVLNDTKNQGLSSLIEIDITRRLRHPNLISTTKIIKKDNTFSLVMPKAETDLNNYLNEVKLSVELKLKLFFDIVSGVKFLHDNRILHLDLKPDNILIFITDNDIKAVVADLSLALYTDFKGNRIFNREKVTANYRAPEILLSPTYYTPYVDIWSLGLILLKILCNGNKLFMDTDINNINTPNGVKQYRKKIMKLLHDQIRLETITTYLTLNGIDYNKVLLDLLYNMLSLNNKERPLTDKIITNELFSHLQYHSGIVKQPKIITTNQININYYRVFDILFRLAYIMNVNVETVFLTSDLFQRSVHLLSSSQQDFNYLFLLMLSCYWIAIKLLEYITITASQIVDTANNIFTEHELKQTEQSIILNLDGIIYRDNLFTLSYCRHQLLDSFEFLRNIRLYTVLDLSKWSCPYSHCHHENEQFSTFFPDTQYYKYFQSNGVIFTSSLDKFNLYNTDVTLIEALFNNEHSN